MELYGPAPTTGRLERKRVLFAWDAEFVAEAFERDGVELAAGSGTSFLKPYLGEGSLFVVDGDPHRRERKVYGAALQGFETARVEYHLGGTLDARGTGSVPLIESLQHTMLEATLDAFLPSLPPARRQQIGADFHAFVASMTRLGLFFPGLARTALLGRRPLDAFRAQDRLRASLAAEWERLQFAKEALDLPAAVKREAWIDRMLTLVVSAFESTATAAAWSLLELYRAPAALDDIENEVRDKGTASRRLHLALLESLRLHPPTPIVVRRCIRPTRLGSVFLKLDDYVVLAIAVAHRDGAHFSAPHEFQVERFAQIARDGRLPYFPFGGGIRNCVGQGVAMKNLAALVSGVIVRGPWRLKHHGLPVVRNLTYAPPVGLRLERAIA